MTAEEAILELLAARERGKSICPSEAARLLAPENWHGALGPVREAARRLAREGRIEITRKGRVVDPDAFKGVIRLRMPIGEVPA